MLEYTKQRIEKREASSPVTKSAVAIVRPMYSHSTAPATTDNGSSGNTDKNTPCSAAKISAVMTGKEIKGIKAVIRSLKRVKKDVE